MHFILFRSIGMEKMIKDYPVKLIHITNSTNSIINKKIKNIFVINLIKDTKKRNYIITLMNKMKINFTFVIVNTLSNSEYEKLPNDVRERISKEELGCCLSHMWCLDEIIRKKQENALIFEDDIIFHKDFCDKITQMNLESCDFLLLGAHDYSFHSLNYQHVKKDEWYHPDPKSDNLFGAHANYYSLKGAKCMFEIRSSFISFFDKEYMLLFNHFNHSSFVCYPNLVVTDISASALNHTKPLLSDEEKYYYDSCFKDFHFNDYYFLYPSILNHNIFFEYLLRNHDNVRLDENIEKYIEFCLKETYSEKEIQVIQKRISSDFFTMKDIENILHVD